MKMGSEKLVKFSFALDEHSLQMTIFEEIVQFEIFYKKF